MTEKDKIRKFVKRNLVVFDEGESFRDDDDIFKLGFVDSPFAIQLVVFIEEEFCIEVTDSDLDITNFSSVNNITEFVKSKIRV